MATTIRRDLYLSPGNTKTGDAASFDLPALSTCPGKTEFCATRCYADNLQKAFPGVGTKYKRNWVFARSDDFIPYMIRHLPHRGTIRIHVSGDFFDVTYIKKWIQIATNRGDCEFYCYTRSWRDRQLWKAIRQLAELSNVTVNLSCDSETGKPKVVDADQFKWCHLTADDSAPKWLRKTDLVFRHNSAGGGHQKRRKNAEAKGLDPNEVAPLVHRIGVTPVCPMERGIKVDLSCSRCRICM